MSRISLSWVVVLGLLSAIGPLCTDFYLPALPEITQQLSATGTQTQLSLTAALGAFCRASPARAVRCCRVPSPATGIRVRC